MHEHQFDDGGVVELRSLSAAYSLRTGEVEPAPEAGALPYRPIAHRSVLHHT